MRRRLLVLGFGIALLLGGSWGLVVLLNGEPPPETEAPAALTAQLPAVSTAPTKASVAPPWVVPATRSTKTPQTWTVQLRDPAAPGKADRTTRKAVRKTLLAAPVAEELTRCVDRDREVWFSGDRESAEAIPRAKPAILILDLQRVGGQVTIAGARVKTWGGTSSAAVACARDVLVGRVVPAAHARPDKPMQMTLLLSPRSQTLATAR